MTQPAAAVEKPRNRLARVVSGKIVQPMRIVLYGGDGVGKSTWAANAPAPIFIGAEDGTAQLDVKRMPDIFGWTDIAESLQELAQTDHPYKSVVLDSADWAEPMCWDFLCALRKWEEGIETPGYGKGYTAALDEWRRVLAGFDRLKARGMHVIVLAHSLIKTFKNPEGEDFDRYELALNGKASGAIRQWADVVLFAQYETFASKDSKTKRVRGVSTGARVVQTRRTAAWDAKNRYNLPETLPLDWHDFIDAVAADRPVDPEIVRKRLAELLEQAEPELRAKAEKAAAAHANDPAALARLADQLASKINLKSQESAS